MPVAGLDHVNIVTHRLDETAAFYEAVLGLTPARSVVEGTGMRGAWMQDASGRAIIHLVGYHPPRHEGRHLPDAPHTGPVDHVSLACTGFAAMLAHIEAMGLTHRVNDRKYADLRQIFLTDPNGVTLELNFAGD